MHLSERIAADLKAAMKASAEFEVGVLRMLHAAIHNREIELRGAAGEKTLDDQATVQVLSREAKKRKEAIELYQKGNRDELAQREQRELAIIARYLPKELDAAQLEAVVDAVLTGSAITDFGAAMKAVREKLKEVSFDGKLVSEIVRRKLGR